MDLTGHHSVGDGKPFPRGNGEIILYTADDGSASIQLRAQGGSIWLTQLEMAELFQTSKQNISLHVKNILAEGEQKESVVKEHLTTASDGKRYKTKLYSLNMILAVGYRVSSHRGTQFRQWATTHLQEYLVKGFVVGRADPKLPNMGLKSWDGKRIRQQDVTIAKNYLNQPELDELNRIVVMYLDYAEDQAKRRNTITMREWDEKLDAFLTLHLSQSIRGDNKSNRYGHLARIQQTQRSHPRQWQ